MSDTGKGPRWHFDYAPIPIGGGDDGSPQDDLVLATTDDVDPAAIVELLAGGLEKVEVTSLFCGHPIYWSRIQSSAPVDRHDLASKLAAAGIAVRYIVSSSRGNQQLPPPLDLSAARPRRPSTWRTREATRGAEPATPWRWFLGVDGADVNRTACGSGAGTRLALIDNDGGQLDRLEVEAEILVGVQAIPRASSHAGLLLGWATGARVTGGSSFRGVAPDASPRLYCIPKSGNEIIWLPLAIVRAVEDGADVVLCATYVEGNTSMLLDDALEFATRLGRGGKGAAVVLPTGREMSSAPESIHSSMSLALAEPASDPRVFCVGPSARDGGWFLWRDRHGKLRPFANRGPALRWLAPGDDMASPLADDDRPAHAESSGASAIASGVLLLLLERNPDLELDEIDRLLVDTVVPVEPAHRSAEPNLGDPADLLPLARDADGHNAKHGYGRLSAAGACLSAADPVAATLVQIGEWSAARRFAEERRLAALYSDRLARWSARVVLRDACVMQAFRCFARAARLSVGSQESTLRQPSGHLLRQVGVALRLLMRAAPPPEVGAELASVECRVREILARMPAAAASDDCILQFVKRIYEGLAEKTKVTNTSTLEERVSRPTERDRFTDVSLAERRNSLR